MRGADKEHKLNDTIVAYQCSLPEGANIEAEEQTERIYHEIARNQQKQRP